MEDAMNPPTPLQLDIFRIQYFIIKKLLSNKLDFLYN